MRTQKWALSQRLDLARTIVAEPIEIVDGKVTARGYGLGLPWD